MSQASQEQQQQPATGPFASVVGTVIGGVLGLLVLVLFVSLMEQEPKKYVEELPHAAVMIDLGDIPLNSPLARVQLVAFQRAIAAAGLSVSGPASYPILVPGKERGAPPTAKGLEQLDQEEAERAYQYLDAGGWLVPRVYSPDRRQVMFRVAPPGQGGFPSGTRDALLRLAKDLEVGDKLPGCKVWIYSRALGLEDDEARNKVNVTFGVQTAPITLRSPQGLLDDGSIYLKLEPQLAKLRDPRLRSHATLGSWVTYAGAVSLQNPKLSLESAPWGPMLELGKKVGIPAFVDAEGKTAVIDVATEAEGEANLEIANLVAAHAGVEEVSAVVPRKRQPRAGCALSRP